MSRELCSVSQDLARYQRSVDDADAKETEIDEETDSLIEKGAEFYPFSTEAVTEALNEIPVADVERIAHMLEDGSIAVAGGALHYAVKNYWLRLARKKAESNVNGRWNDCRCHGHGCPRCEPPDRESED